MKFQCPKCRSNSFRIVTPYRGMPLAECLDCREPSAFSISAMLDASGRARLAATVPSAYGHRIGRSKLAD